MAFAQRLGQSGELRILVATLRGPRKRDDNQDLRATSRNQVPGAGCTLVSNRGK